MPDEKKCECEVPTGELFLSVNPYDEEINPPDSSEWPLDESWWCTKCYQDCADDI